MVVAQLVEQSLLTPEIRGSNPDIDKILSTNCSIESTKIKKKKPGMVHLTKSIINQIHFCITYKDENSSSVNNQSCKRMNLS